MNDNDKQPDSSGGNPWMKSLMIWVGILLALALFVQLFDSRGATASSSEIAYSTFLDKIDQGSVKDASISREAIVWTSTSGDKFRTRPLPVPDPTLAADADIGAEGRTERRRRPPELDRDLRFLEHCQAEPTVIFRDRQAEQPHRFHLVDHVLRDRVGRLDLAFQGAQSLGDEAADMVDQRVEGLGVEGHGRIRSVRLAAGLSRAAPRRKRRRAIPWFRSTAHGERIRKSEYHRGEDSVQR